jgi:DNA-binding MarR family transcriptional regulator
MENLIPEICSCSAVRQAARHMTRFYDDILSPVGIGLNQYSILSKLDRYGPKILQDLAAQLIMDRSTLGRLLRPLEQRGLVTLNPSTEDGRQKIIALSQAGLELLGTAKPLWAQAEARFEDIFGPTNALGLRAMMRQITTVDFAAS